MLKTVKHDAKANFLLEKGIEILWSKGYNGTSVNDIVKAADVPKGSFYFYFESKEDFTIKAIEKYFNAHFAPSKDILEDKSIAPKQRLLDFYEFRARMLKDEMGCKLGCMACNLASEMAEHNEKIRTAILVKEQVVLSLITGVIQEAQELGEIKKTMKAEVIAAFIEDAGKGSMISMKEMKSAVPIDNFMTMVKEILL
ncbi:TetR/AcrR family transcriptional regulator [Flavivirga spongiicola]|uniref:TetR/AcrR family transcriptional regulator n=1 Tax=Flavivirga spongiicola TaxID=421621 RepID=A0ABU7XTE1_9FLAO|nr:TetR/AcrR family transcriptional regulator [Flavivirga sp. MEBiC05379]MDO5978704.1 TetR/AcrR family transcriptional regulator [Flavivirga sp. MEBiC05379]